MSGILLSRWIRHCSQHFLLNIWHRLWRRKHIVLALILVSTLLLVAINYSSVSVLHVINNKDFNNNNNKNANEINENLNKDKVKSIKDFKNGPNVDVLSQTQVNINGLSSSDDKKLFNSKLIQNNNNNNNNENNKDKNKKKEPEYGIFDRKVVPNNEIKSINSIQKLNDNQINDKTNDRLIASKEKYIPEIRLVHIDLKGAPPKVAFFQQIFPLLKQSGANGILLEYEDMFPFWGSLSAGSAGNAYTKEDVKTIIDLAESNKFEVIPLIQTFGHLEFFLKLKEYRHLREVDDFPQAICPSKNDSFALVMAIVDQVMSMHPNSKWLHIGCDEVYHIGFCDKCRFKDRDTIFLSQVTRVAKYVREKYKVIPIIWDDMLRQIPTERIKESKLTEYGVEPMIWTYIKDIYRFIPYSQWISFSELFPHVWSASAFKGAFGETLTVPNIKMHLENNEAWIEVMAEQHKNFKSIRGIAITGWQRYDHLANLCELFPSGMPSLIINLLTNSEGGFDSKNIFKKFDKIMGCNSNDNVNNYYGSNNRQEVDFENDPYLFTRTAGCFFPGSQVYRLMQIHTDTIKRVNDYLYDITIHKAWLTDYNVRHNISSPHRIDEGLQEYTSVYYSLQSLLRTAKEALKEVYDDYTVSEWIEQNIYPYFLKMEDLMDKSVNLKKAKVWPKRPIKILEDLKRFVDQTNNNRN